MTLVSAGTLTGMPSTSRLTVTSDLTAGVPMSRLGMMKSFILRPPYGVRCAR